MNTVEQQNILHFSLYPPLGEEDWRYTFATAQVKSLSEKFFDSAFFAELTNSGSFAEAVELLGGTDYAVSASASNEEIEKLLCDRRREAKKLICQLLLDEKIIEFLQARSDFANMRLAIRRLVLEKPLGSPTDYCDRGNIPVDQFELVFEQEDYAALPRYLQEAVEAGVLGYYKNKNVRDIDIAIDKVEAEFQLENAKQAGSVFLVELMKMHTDITNIRTMMRLKFTEMSDRDVFMPGGYIDSARLSQMIDIGYDGLAHAFAATPYYAILEAGAGYMQSNNSFLKLEAAVERHFLGFLKNADQITAGHQPIVAYLFRKEQEIRMVRMVLACKKAQIEPNVINDRIVV
ncbi:MAG: V-type ATPase subunit [Planctomycetes bacterium]|nr:V-type ATPase subunit [Planctomycetota bacterium]MBU1518233.1 V-type ATPase subunit [Planctomycetota bacterium]MBU2457554.1 V-type ATPase subunit [Planctomycetota bacterium]MBU2596367.1 V-type ATPase subunit [Planctomycetota bacterium]